MGRRIPGLLPERADLTVQGGLAHPVELLAERLHEGYGVLVLRQGLRRIAFARLQRRRESVHHVACVSPGSKLFAEREGVRPFCASLRRGRLPRKYLRLFPNTLDARVRERAPDLVQVDLRVDLHLARAPVRVLPHG